MNILQYASWIIVIICIFIVVDTKKKAKERDDSKLPVKGIYQRKWMFTTNEKEAYHKLKETAEKNGYTVFAKVRLYDLLEPHANIQKRKTYLYKIQAKHVDFVLCDQKLIARYIIELDDKSHERNDRKQRDEFVDSILEDVGYKVLHIQAVLPDQIEAFLKA